MSTQSLSSVARWLPDYRTVWRWHFYAGVFCLPFVVVLSLSGSVYLFKHEVEAWVEQPYNGVARTVAAALPTVIVANALQANPQGRLQGYELPTTETSAVRVLVDHHGHTQRVYVHPETAVVLGQVAEQERFFRQVFRLHGELWMGDRGSMLVELAASWTIVMVLTGLLLWWPRNQRGWGGILYPRWHATGRAAYRDWHGVTGFWISGLVLALLLSGLPWAKFWGSYLKEVRARTGLVTAKADWSTSSRGKAADATGVSAGGEHGRHGSRSAAGPAADLTQLNRVVATAIEQQLPPPVVVAPPREADGPWSVRSNTANRPRRVTLQVHGLTGDVVSREDFSNKHWIDQLVAVGVAAHEGQLFGWLNQLLGLLTAIGLVLVAVSGLAMSRSRLGIGVLNAPPPGESAGWMLGLVAMLGLLGTALPMFGGSLLLVWIFERVVLRRLPRVSTWLGLREASPNH